MSSLAVSETALVNFPSLEQSNPGKKNLKEGRLIELSILELSVHVWPHCFWACGKAGTSWLLAWRREAA
jgi:hypothetical protein